MNIIQSVKGFFMNILKIIMGQPIEELIGIKSAISSEMYDAICKWNDMASGRADWNEKAPPCGILEQIAGQLHMMVMRELGITVRNKAIEQVMLHLNDNVDKFVDYIALVGASVLRPIFANGKLQYEIIPLGNYIPLAYDFDGTLTSAVILKEIADGSKKFVLIETHEYKGNAHSVVCKLYKNDNGTLKRANLIDCSQTENITPEYTWQNVKRPMIVEFRNHATNKIDGSNIPVAMIGAPGVAKLIQLADEQFERMNWEQQGGEMRVFADRDLFRKRNSKNATVGTVLDKTTSRLIMQVDGDGTQGKERIKDFAPPLRTLQQNEMLQQIFRRIELTLNIGKGTISDMESTVQTATQYSGGRQSLFAIVDKIESEIEAKYKECAKVFSHMASAYGLGANDFEIEILWSDDTTRKDIVATKQMRLQEISAGVLNKYEYRMTEFHEDEATAKANVPQQETQGLEDLFGKEE